MMPATTQKPTRSAERHQSPSRRSRRGNGKLRDAAATTGSQPVEQRIRLTGVDWETFEKLAATSRGGRFAFDQGVLEIMSPGPLHEGYAGDLGEFIRIVTRTLRIPRKAMRSTTWKRPEAERGIEADDCFYLSPEKIAAANAADERGSNDSVDYPAPDLAVEVDISAPQVDRPAIYATIRVPEIWRVVDNKVRIEHLDEDGTYTRSRSSRFLPVRDRDLERWLIDEDRSDEPAWEERLAAWAQGLAKPRGPRRARRKPGG
jgi:Uma2 family endonuclease